MENFRTSSNFTGILRCMIYMQRLLVIMQLQNIIILLLPSSSSSLEGSELTERMDSVLERLDQLCLSAGALRIRSESISDVYRLPQLAK